MEVENKESLEERAERIMMISAEMNSFNKSHPKMSEKKLGDKFSQLWDLDIKRLRVLYNYKNSLFNGRNKNRGVERSPQS
jgi:hypothetical protein